MGTQAAGPAAGAGDLAATPESADQSEAGVLIVAARGAGWTSVEALRPADGVALWAYEPHLELSDVCCADGSVFVAMVSPNDQSEPARIVALNAKDGSERWRAGSERYRQQLARARLACGLRWLVDQASVCGAFDAMRSLRLAGHLTLVADGDVVVAHSHDVLFAFDAASGALRWLLPPRPGLSKRVFAVSGGRVYVIGERGGIQALDARTGARRWASARPNAVERGETSESRLYVYGHGSGSHSEEIATLRTADGTVAQTHKVRSQQRQHTEAPHVVALDGSGVAYLLRDSRLCALRLEDERELWRGERLEGLKEDAQGRSETIPQAAISGDRFTYAYAALDEQARTRRLHVGALDVRSGAILWHWRGPEHPPRTGGQGIAAAFGHVFVSTRDGTYAFRAEDGHPLWSLPAGFDVIRMQAVPAESAPA